MVADEPIPSGVLAQLLEVSHERIRVICHELAEGYRAQQRGFELVEVAGGWRFQSHGDLAAYVERYVLEGQVTRLSAAALETLAIVAYKQPVSRGQMSAIRGVNVDGVLKTLVHRGYVAEVGRDPGIGQAVLYGTTSQFLESLGLAAIGDLPGLGDFVPSAEIIEALERGLLADQAEAVVEAVRPNAPAPQATLDGDG